MLSSTSVQKTHTYMKMSSTMMNHLKSKNMNPNDPMIVALRDMLECDVRYLGEIGLNRTERVEFLDAMLKYYAYHLESIRAVESIRVLREVF